MNCIQIPGSKQMHIIDLLYLPTYPPIAENCVHIKSNYTHESIRDPVSVLFQLTDGKRTKDH